MTILFLCLLFGCQPSDKQNINIIHKKDMTHKTSMQTNINSVNPTDYRAFWLWGVPKHKKALANAQSIYVLQGHVYKNSPKLIRQGTGVLNFYQPNRTEKTAQTKKAIWLVYRTDALNWQASTLDGIIKQIHYWEKQGQPITGIQIDFDAATQKLADYGRFLKAVRAQLPKQYRLSITGLLDWTNHIDAIEKQLGAYIDDITIQTYQKTSTVTGYTSYLTRLKKLKIPFKIGLIEKGSWDKHFDENIGLQHNPYFQGYVVFLLQDN